MGNRRFETIAVTEGEEPESSGNKPGDVVKPIHLSTTFAWDELDRDANEYMYSRLSNPTRKALEERIAAFENGEYGLALSSGTAAISATCMSVLDPGDHVVTFDDLYGGTKELFRDMFEEVFGIEFSYVDATKTENVANAVTPETELIWMESPTNPSMNMCDLEAIAGIADQHNAVMGVDNTFMSPYFQNPLNLGADVVAHSTTKFLNGHSDSVGGAVVTSDEDLYEDIRFYQEKVLGASMSPFDSFLVLRGTKTLPIRMERHEENASSIAEYLEGHEKISKVNYPGLKSHPQHDLARRQMSGFGGVLSFEVDGDMRDTKAFLEGLDLFSLAVSLGGVESLIEHPASMTHAQIPREQREAVGITDSLVRASIGIENVNDLIDDLEKALRNI